MWSSGEACFPGGEDYMARVDPSLHTWTRTVRVAEDAPLLGNSIQNQALDVLCVVGWCYVFTGISVGHGLEVPPPGDASGESQSPPERGGRGGLATASGVIKLRSAFSCPAGPETGLKSRRSSC